MKLIKFGIVVTAVTLMLGALSAKATLGIGTVANFSKLNISIIITTNPPYTSKGDVRKFTSASVKFTNKDLLNLFAAWAGTDWPSGAQLVQGWDDQWHGDVLVVDKSGTNVLFDANVDSDHSFTISIFDGVGSYNESQTQGNNPGSDSYTSVNHGSFELFDDGVYLQKTDIFGDGPSMEKFSIKWGSNHDFTSWSDSEKLTVDNAGAQFDSDLEFLGYTADGGYLSVHAELDSSGHGAGDPPYLY